MLANTRMILAAARAWRPTLMVGPLPVCADDVDARIAEVSTLLAPLCDALDVPYLAVFQQAANSSAWRSEVAAGDGAHPNTIGYGLIGDAFQCWSHWRSWIASR
jgi:lysophospholipase L1-like esterase